MTDLAERIDREAESLRAMRDELRLELHLGKAEVRERWEKLEKEWQKIEGKLKQIRDTSRDDLEQVGSALRLVLDEIRAGYGHLKSLL